MKLFLRHAVTVAGADETSEVHFVSPDVLLHDFLTVTKEDIEDWRRLINLSFKDVNRASDSPRSSHLWRISHTAQVVRASDRDPSLAPHSGGFPGMTNWEETSRQTQDQLEGLCISSGSTAGSLRRSWRNPQWPDWAKLSSKQYQCFNFCHSGRVVHG